MANTITGMIKVFKQNMLIGNISSMTATSGDDSVANLIDFDRDTKWQSIGSNDTTEEIITIELNSDSTIDRIVLLGMNFKEFFIQYWNGAIWVDFADVYDSKDASVASEISSTTNTETSKYYEFTAVSTEKIQISCTQTITVDAQKFLTELYIGEEVGTFIEDLTSQPNTYIPILSNTRAIYISKSNGGTKKYERGDKYSTQVDLKEMLEVADQTIIDTMYEIGQFAIYPCGGVPYVQQGWRAQDFFNVIIRGNKEAEFAIGRVAYMGLNYSFKLLEQ